MNAKVLGCLFFFGSFGVFADTLYVAINDSNASDEPGAGRGAARAHRLRRRHGHSRPLRERRI